MSWLVGKHISLSNWQRNRIAVLEHTGNGPSATKLCNSGLASTRQDNYNTKTMNWVHMHGGRSGEVHNTLDVPDKNDSCCQEECLFPRRPRPSMQEAYIRNM